jgi:hypothetical protein
MALSDIASSTAQIPLALVGNDLGLARELQALLGRVGLLDPPIDGKFGPVSHWALQALLQRLGFASSRTINPVVAQALLSTANVEPYPIKERDSFASRIVQAMIDKGYWVQRHPDCFNIVYVEGAEIDGSSNTNEPNQFNDVRVVLRITPAGHPEIMGAWEATTEPGHYHTVIAPLDPGGAARIAFGQYKAWAVGTHNRGKKSEHAALVQVNDITVHRDLNRDFARTGDVTSSGLFGVNQHSGYDLKKSDIGKASAGCLVGRTRSGHKSFMKICESDARYTASNGYRFMTTVMRAGDVGSIT